MEDRSWDYKYNRPADNYQTKEAQHATEVITTFWAKVLEDEERDAIIEYAKSKDIHLGVSGLIKIFQLYPEMPNMDKEKQEKARQALNVYWEVFPHQKTSKAKTGAKLPEYVDSDEEVEQVKKKYYKNADDESDEEDTYNDSLFAPRYEETDEAGDSEKDDDFEEAFKKLNVNCLMCARMIGEN